MAEGLEQAIGDRADVGGEADTENVQRIDFAGSVSEPNQVHRPLAVREKSFEGIVGALLRKIAQKRIAGADRKEAQRNAIGIGVAGEDAVDDFVSGAVAADGQEVPVALGIGFAGEFAGVSGPPRRR
jgi:hypothetical protein